jgi:hypothetical protein
MFDGGILINVLGQLKVKEDDPFKGLLGYVGDGRPIEVLRS